MNASEGQGVLSLVLSAVGWVPAVVFPSASFLQLFALARRGRSDGVSVTTWSLFAVANVCLYLTIGEWTKPQVVISTLGAAATQFAVATLAWRLRRPAADKRAAHHH
jgi:hypothetical protein